MTFSVAGVKSCFIAPHFAPPLAWVGLWVLHLVQFSSFPSCGSGNIAFLKLQTFITLSKDEG